MTVSYRDQERTLAQMAPFLEETDRAVRQEAWDLAAARRLADRETLDDLFDRMIGSASRWCTRRDLRISWSMRFGTGSGSTTASRIPSSSTRLWSESWFRCRGGYTRSIAPRWVSSRSARGMSRLTPWAGRRSCRSATSSNSPPGPSPSSARLTPSLANSSHSFAPNDCSTWPIARERPPADIRRRFEDDRLPFIFMNAVGLDSDVRTLLHEGGHAFHTLACRGEPLSTYRESPLEFCEVASMSMELLGVRRLDPFYNGPDADRSCRKLLEGIVLILPWIATVDAFQHWIYNHPDHTRDDRKAAWKSLLDRFGGLVDWSGYEEARDHSWHRQLHIFLYPFYYIEYGIAQLGALQIWQRSLTDRAGAVADYKKALALGGSRPLPELFEAAGIRFDFRDDLIASLMKTVGQQLDQLNP